MKPTPEQIKSARIYAGMTQDEASKVIHRSRRGWQDCERGQRQMPEDSFELFLLKTGQHPTLRIVEA